MRISLNDNCITPRHRLPRRTQKEAIRMMHEAGIDTVNFSLLDYDPNINIALGENYIAAAKDMREYCEGLGMKINQTHVPFFENRPMPEGYQDILKRCVETSALLGADCVVVHADTWYDTDYVQWDYDKVLASIYEVFAPVVDVAAKCGIKLAMETLFEWCGTPEHRVRFCSYIEELDAIAGKFSTDIVGACWDFGHGRMSYGAGQFEMMKKLNTKIIAMHMHDNTGRMDAHTLPFIGNTDWFEAMKTLADIGYAGDLTFELNYLNLPGELAVDFMKYVRKTGKYLISQFEECKKQSLRR